MKGKKIIGTIAMFLAILIVMSGCGNSSNNNGENDSTELKNIMFVVTGSLGGGTNNDDVYTAIEKYVSEVNGKVDTFECNMDTSLYESTLMQAA